MTLWTANPLEWRFSAWDSLAVIMILFPSRLYLCVMETLLTLISGQRLCQSSPVLLLLLSGSLHSSRKSLFPLGIFPKAVEQGDVAFSRTFRGFLSRGISRQTLVMFAKTKGKREFSSLGQRFTQNPEAWLPQQGRVLSWGMWEDFFLHPPQCWWPQCLPRVMPAWTNSLWCHMLPSSAIFQFHI